jgi:hypothetical protein
MDTVEQVIPDVVSRVTDSAELTVEYDGKPISNGEHLAPSEAQVQCMLIKFRRFKGVFKSLFVRSTW